MVKVLESFSAANENPVIKDPSKTALGSFIPEGFTHVIRGRVFHRQFHSEDGHPVAETNLFVMLMGLYTAEGQKPVWRVQTFDQQEDNGEITADICADHEKGPFENPFKDALNKLKTFEQATLAVCGLGKVHNDDLNTETTTTVVLGAEQIADHYSKLGDFSLWTKPSL